MRFARLVISWERAEHIWGRHRITREEAREAFEQGQVFRGPTSDEGRRTYIIRGRTYAGRRLWLLVKPGGQSRAILITARDDA